MKPRLPLYTKVLFLAFLNLCLLGLAVMLIVRAAFRFDPGSFLLAPAQNRILNVAHTLALELDDAQPRTWPSAWRWLHAGSASGSVSRRPRRWSTNWSRPGTTTN
jgi:hypothetical protein